MNEKINRLIKHPLLQQVRDVRFLGFCVFGVIVLLVAWSGVGVIETNYKLQKQISALQQQNQVFELQNRNLALGNDYFKTDQYLELQARKQFGKAAPGETLLLVPKQVALGHTVDLNAQKETPKKVVNKPFYQRNFEAWVDFLFRRSGQS
jgi:cell division protein FtsB